MCQLITEVGQQPGEENHEKVAELGRGDRTQAFISFIYEAIYPSIRMALLAIAVVLAALNQTSLT